MSGTTNGVATAQPNVVVAGRDASAVAVIDTDEADMGGVLVGLAGPELHDVTSNAAPSNSGSLVSCDMENLRPRQSKLSASADADRAGIIPANSDPEEGCL
jgi:hypothetical protein